MLEPVLPEVNPLPKLIKISSFPSLFKSVGITTTQTVNKLSLIAAELFKNVKSITSINEKNFIAQKNHK